MEYKFIQKQTAFLSFRNYIFGGIISIMKLITRCDSCGQDMNINTLASTRSELQMEKGDYFDVNCQNCGSTRSKHVNDFTAVQSMRLTIIGFTISVIAGIVMFFTFEGHTIWFSGLIFIIPIYFWNDQMQKTKAFNVYMVRRK